MDQTSKHRLKAARSNLKQARKEYSLARWAALVAGRQARSRRTGHAYMIREAALDEALERRYWMGVARSRLARQEDLPVVGFDPTGA